MLKRNKVLVAFLVVAVLIASVGFAAVADDLILKGNIVLNLSGGGEGETQSPLDEEFEENVKWASYDSTETGVTGKVDTNDSTADTLVIDIDKTVFTKLEQVVTVKATIKNDNTIDAAVSVATPSGEAAKYVTVAVTDQNIVVPAKNTKQITITYTLKALPTADTFSGNYSLTLTATPVDPT